jgi:hypothetical protein
MSDLQDLLETAAVCRAAAASLVAAGRIAVAADYHERAEELEREAEALVVEENDHAS